MDIGTKKHYNHYNINHSQMDNYQSFIFMNANLIFEDQQAY